MTNNIETSDYSDCVRCHERITNPFSKNPWCSPCGDILKGMSYNGEQVLEMVTAMMPPTPPSPSMVIQVSRIHSIVRRVLINQGILLEADSADEAPKPSILLG